MKTQGKISGLLLFLAGVIIFMGIITGEIFYTLPFNTHDNYISELAAPLPPNIMIPQPSAAIFNLSMIFSGIMIIIATWLLYTVFKKLIVSIPLGLFGTGILGVGIFPGNIAPWHGIFALLLFITGGISAITSYKIVIAPLRITFILLGITSIVFLVFYKFFVPFLGVGGAERWVFYPIVLWVSGFGGYLTGMANKNPAGLTSQDN